MTITQRIARAAAYTIVSGVLLTASMIGDPSHAEDAPDITVAPCSWWSDDATPELPAYTATDRCAQADGTLSYATTARVLPVWYVTYQMVANIQRGALY